MLKESILFEGALGDDINNVVPIVINKAKELEKDVFIRWNGVTVRVSPKSTIYEILQKYSDELHLISLRTMECNGELISKGKLADKISSIIMKILTEKL